MQVDGQQPQLVVSQQGTARRVTLNRPEALNALTFDMVRGLARILAEWDADPEVTLILLDASGEKAFCAGGDVGRLYIEGRDGNTDFCATFWKENYDLNAQIAGLATPFVAFMDGIVLGGGVGISSHGAIRVVTERTMLAMPECGIGLVPDVGVSALLAKLPEALAKYVALTGLRLSGVDCIGLGLADWPVPSARMDALAEVLMCAGDAGPLESYTMAAEQSGLGDISAAVELAFAGQDVSKMQAKLAEQPGNWAERALKSLEGGSPTSQALTLAMLKIARTDNDLRRCLDRDLRAATYCMEHGDFLEGVRAAIIDKDRAPQWQEASRTPREFEAWLISVVAEV